MMSVAKATEACNMVLRTILVSLSLLTAAALGDAKPNVLLIFMDNVGYGDLGCYGNPRNKTPHIDRLAAQGVRCTDFYIGSPSCTPSRGAILTGRHPLRNGLNWQLSAEQNRAGYGLPLREFLIPQYLKPLGYHTACLGKWNIGFGPGASPVERGFDEFLGFASGNIGYFNYRYNGWNDLRQGTAEIHREGLYSTDLFADAAIDFMRRHRDQSWFVYLPFNAVHFIGAPNVAKGESMAWQVPAKYLAMYGAKDDEPDQRVRFAAVVTAMDAAIGRVLQTIDDLKQRDRTLVICLSDNGAFMLPGRGLEVQSNLPLREGGVTTYEGGIRIPAMMRWPGRIKHGTTCSRMLWSMDLLPMIVKAAGGKLPQGLTLDGRDPTAALAGEAPSPHQQMGWEWRQGRQIWQGYRQDNWKLVRSDMTKPWELYDLSKDLSESRDLASNQPDRLKSLAADFDRWRKEVTRR